MLHEQCVVHALFHILWIRDRSIQIFWLNKFHIERCLTIRQNPITLDEIIAAVNKEDLLCIEIVEEIGQKLGKQIAGLINIFNPELVIIGGTLSLTGDYITQPIKTAVRKYSLNLVNKDSAIITSKLKDKAGIVGACMLARSRMFES